MEEFINRKKKRYRLYLHTNGEHSLVGRASDCGSEGHGFDPRCSPQD